MQYLRKPKLIVSKCLGFGNCRYNSQVLKDEWVDKLKPWVEFLPVCPEVEIGLGVPRQPVRIAFEKKVKHLYQPATGKDYTQEITKFTEHFVLQIKSPSGFLLKSASPSCGFKNVKAYMGLENGSRAMNKESGFFGGKIAEAFADYPIEDEGRLKNFSIRENFFISIFCLSRFYEIKENLTIATLMHFHETHKLLFMALHQVTMREMGKMIAEYPKKPQEEIAKQYEQKLLKILSNPIKPGNMINVLLHAFGGFKKVLADEEKKLFLNSLEEYRDERIPLSSVIYLIKAWSVRFKNDYLLNQVLLNPYPKELIQITDSGKGRDE